MKGVFVDLTHTIDPSIPTWNGSCGFSAEIKKDYPQGVRVMKYSMHAGIGTHIDAPCHFYANTSSCADLALEDLLVPAYVLHLSQRRSPDLCITKEDIQEFEKEHGKIQKRSLFLAHTGWDVFWKNPHQYRNCDEKGKMHYPGYAKEAAEYLVEKEIVGLGIDTLSPDGCNQGYPVHEVVLGSGRYILENLAQLQKMPAKGAFALILPMKIQDGAEAPVRAVGFIPEAI